MRLYVLSALFLISLLVSISASAAFTRRLETLSDRFHFSPGLLSLLGALGANIPNYVASLAAAASGQVGEGIGIIIGSNIYNVAVILGIVAFASPGRHGLMFSRQEARDARQVGNITLAIMAVAALAAGIFSWKVALHVSAITPQVMVLTSGTLLALNILMLGLLGLLFVHAFRRAAEPESTDKEGNEQEKFPSETASSALWSIIRPLSEAVIALGLALGGVIVMVQTGQAVAQDIHLPQAVLSLIILAIATSLPNTIVAFILARTDRASASIEEIFSSNSVNAALGIALPLLFWSGLQSDRLLIVLDGPLMLVLTLTALFCTGRQRVSRLTGGLLILVYVCWLVLHLFLA